MQYQFFSYTCYKSLVQDGILVTLLNWSSDSLGCWAMKSPHPTTFQKKLIIYRGCALRDNTCKVNENLPICLNRISLYLSKKINKWKKYHILMYIMFVLLEITKSHKTYAFIRLKKLSKKPSKTDMYQCFSRMKLYQIGWTFIFACKTTMSIFTWKKTIWFYVL